MLQNPVTSEASRKGGGFHEVKNRGEFGSSDVTLGSIGVWASMSKYTRLVSSSLRPSYTLTSQFAWVTKVDEARVVRDQL